MNDFLVAFPRGHIDGNARRRLQVAEILDPAIQKPVGPQPLKNLLGYSRGRQVQRFNDCDASHVLISLSLIACPHFTDGTSSMVPPFFFSSIPNAQS